MHIKIIQTSFSSLYLVIYNFDIETLFKHL